MTAFFKHEYVKAYPHGMLVTRKTCHEFDFHITVTADERYGVSNHRQIECLFNSLLD